MALEEAGTCVAWAFSGGGDVWRSRSTAGYCRSFLPTVPDRASVEVNTDKNLLITLERRAGRRRRYSLRLQRSSIVRRQLGARSRRGQFVVEKIILCATWPIRSLWTGKSSVPSNMKRISRSELGGRSWSELWGHLTRLWKRSSESKALQMMQSHERNSDKP